MPNPYEEHLDGRDPVDVLRRSLGDYEAIASRVTAAEWVRPWAPGKWTLRQIVVHVAQWEMIFGMRVRCALGVPGYVVQPLNQDDLMGVEDRAVDGPTALEAFVALRRMNLACAAALSAADRQRICQHRERGPLKVDDLLVTLAGHPVHHYKQIAQTLAV
jgi:hypothetical protein